LQKIPCARKFFPPVEQYRRIRSTQGRPGPATPVRFDTAPDLDAGKRALVDIVSVLRIEQLV
jgi:hypothetical protein